MATIRISDLANATSLHSQDKLPVDRSGGTSRSILATDLANSVRPYASQVEAQAGTANDKTMTPLRTFEAITQRFSGAALTGAPTAPTPTAGDNSTRIATTAWARSGGNLADGSVTAAKLASGVAVSNIGFTPARADENVVWIISNTTKTFGPSGDFTTWTALKTWLAARRIAPGVTLTVSIAAGTHAATASDYLQINHPDGPRIQIVGAGSATTIIEVQRAPSADVWGCEIVNGSGLGLINGVTIRGNGWGGSQGVWTNDGTGNGRRCWGVGGFNNTGSVQIGADVIIERCYVGVRCEGTGESRILAGATVRDAGDASVLARGSTRIVARGAIARGPGDATYNLGHNFIAEDNAYVDCTGAISTFAPSYGGHCATQGGGTMDTREMLIGFNADGTASTGGGIAFRTLGGNGVIDAKGSVVRDCFGTAQALDGGVIEVAGVLSFDHQSGGFHFEAKQGGNIHFGFYLPIDYPNRQGSPGSALATRTTRTSAGPTENTYDLSVLAGSYTNENYDANALARLPGSITVVSTSYSPAGGVRAKAINVVRNAYNGDLIPVAPQPVTTGGALGEFKTLEAFSSSTVNLAANGTWAYFAVGMNSSSNTIDHKTGIAAGGSTITFSGSVTTIRGFQWRVS